MSAPIHLQLDPHPLDAWVTEQQRNLSAPQLLRFRESADRYLQTRTEEPACTDNRVLLALLDSATETLDLTALSQAVADADDALDAALIAAVHVTHALTATEARNATGKARETIARLDPSPKRAQRRRPSQ